MGALSLNIPYYFTLCVFTSMISVRLFRSGTLLLLSNAPSYALIMMYIAAFNCPVLETVNDKENISNVNVHTLVTILPGRLRKCIDKKLMAAFYKCTYKGLGCV